MHQIVNDEERLSKSRDRAQPFQPFPALGHIPPAGRTAAAMSEGGCREVYRNNAASQSGPDAHPLASIGRRGEPFQHLLTRDRAIEGG